MMDEMTPERVKHMLLSPLIAAQEMMQRGPYYYEARGDDTPIPTCKWCGRSSWGEVDHSQGCLWLSMPSIVTELERRQSSAADTDLLAALEASRAALPDPGKLWSLALWLDEKYPNDPLPVVQDDLRAWARAIYDLDPKKYGKSGVYAIEALTPAAEEARGE